MYRKPIDPTFIICSLLNLCKWIINWKRRVQNNSSVESNHWGQSFGEKNRRQFMRPFVKDEASACRPCSEQWDRLLASFLLHKDSIGFLENLIWAWILLHCYCVLQQAFPRAISAIPQGWSTENQVVAGGGVSGSNRGPDDLCVEFVFLFPHLCRLPPRVSTSPHTLQRNLRRI